MRRPPLRASTDTIASDPRLARSAATASGFRGATWRPALTSIASPESPRASPVAACAETGTTSRAEDCEEATHSLYIGTVCAWRYLEFAQERGHGARARHGHFELVVRAYSWIETRFVVRERLRSLSRAFTCTT